MATIFGDEATPQTDSVFGDLPKDYTTVALAASNHDLAASGGLIDGLYSGVTQGLPAVLVSTISALANVPHDLVNIPVSLGLIDDEIAPDLKTDTSTMLAALDNTLGSDLDAYYAKHKEGVDMGGFVASSLVPGTLGVKALRMGLSSAKKLESTSNMAKALGLVDNISETTLQAAKLEIAKGSPFSYFSADAFKLYAAGAGQGVLDTLAFNTAATVALHKSPYLDEKSGWELAKDALYDSLLFGAATGAFIDYAGKGVGVLGLRSELKGYTERNIIRQTQAAESDFNPLFTANAKYVEPVQNGNKIVNKVRTVAPGDEAAYALTKAHELNTAMMDGATAEAKGLFSKDPMLLKAEREAYVNARQSAADRLGLQAEVAIRKTLSGIDDIVDVDALVVQLKAKQPQEAAVLLSGNRGFTRVSESVSLESLKEGLPKKITPVFIDLKNNTVIDKLDGMSAWDVSSAEYRKIMATRPVSFTSVDTVTKGVASSPISRGELTGLTGSAQYRAASDEITAMGDKLTKSLAKTEFSFEDDFAKLDLLSREHPNVNLLVDGDIVDASDIQYLIQERKLQLAREAIAAGKAPEEVSAMLHMPESTVLNFSDAAGTTLPLGNRPVRYVVANYDTAVRDVGINRFYQEGTLNVMAREKAYMDEVNAVMMRDAPDIHQLGALPMEDFNAGGVAGAVKFADAQVGNINQEAIQLFSKRYDNIMRTAANDRVEVIQSRFNAIIGAGRTSEQYVETAAFTAWTKHAANKGNGAAIWYGADGNTYALTRKTVDDAFEFLKHTGAETKGMRLGEQLDMALLGRMPDGSGTKVSLNHLIKDGISNDNEVIKITTPELKAFIVSHNQLDSEALRKTNNLRRLHGEEQIKKFGDGDRLHGYYSPPPDKRALPFALVVKGADNHANPLYRGQVYVQAFKDEKALIAGRIEAEKLGLTTYTTKETKDFYKSVDHYENALGFNSGALKRDLTNTGKYTEFAIEGAETVEQTMARYTSWHARNELALQRNHIGMVNAKEFATLKSVSYIQEATRESRMGAANKLAELITKDHPTPEEKIINQLLNSQSGGAINAVLRTADTYGNNFFNGVADFFRGANRKPSLFGKTAELSVDEAANLAKSYEKLGIEKSYQEAIYSALEKKPGADAAFDKMVRITNMTLATGQLRLDPLNALVNIVGAPIIGSSTTGLQIRAIRNRLVKRGDEAAINKFDEALGLGAGGEFGSSSVNFVKMWHQAIKRQGTLAKDSPALADFANGKETVAEFAHRMGITTNGTEAARQEIQNDLLSLIHTNNLVAKKSEALSIGQKFWKGITKPSDMVEGHLQYLGADIGLQIAEAAGLQGREALGIMNTVVQKLQGNFTAAQKPQIFQGTVGAAIGLFQAYQARMIHRILDVVDSGDKRMLAEMAALQAGIFGVKSMPFFDAVNANLVADGNKDKQDIYTGVYGAFDRRLAGTLMYGSASSLIGLNLSTRGAVDFRAPDTWTKIPAVDIWNKQLTQISDFAKNVKNGADISTELNHAVQHNVFNRPIQQAGVYFGGAATTLSGNEAINPNDTKFTHSDNWLPHQVTQAMRMLGGRPLDEAVLMDTVFRYQTYRLADREKSTRLGQAMVSQLRAADGKELDPAVVKDFQEKYLAAGGNVEGFNRKIKSAYANASTDASERLRKVITNDAQAKQLSIMLGAQESPGFSIEETGN